MITDIVSTTGMLLAFVVILFLAWQASRYLGKNAPYGNKGGKMRILEQLKVGNDQYIILLKLDENQYLLGTSQTGIQVLERFKEEPTAGVGARERSMIPKGTPRRRLAS